MKIKQLEMKERWIFKITFFEGTYQEHLEFIGNILADSIASLNYKVISEKEARCSLKCNSEEEYKKLYKNLDKIILNYL